MSIIPKSGRVFLTDYNTAYPDASDHNLVMGGIQLDERTAVNVGTFNVRRYDLDKPPYDWDTHRDSRCARLIAATKVSILAVQECMAPQDAYLLKKLPEVTGVPWKAVSASTNVGLFYKSDRWRVLDTRGATFDNDDQPDRRLVLAYIQSIGTGSKFWFGSTHLGVGLPLAIWRRRQAKGICDYLSNVPGYGDVRPKTVMMGDLNDWAQYQSPGVRQVFAEYGFFDLPTRLSDAAFVGNSVRTNHGFGKLTERDGRQIDAIFTVR